MVFIKKNQRGVSLIISLVLIGALICTLTFSWDVARYMYYKVYARNYASVVAISIVNECKDYTAYKNPSTGVTHVKPYIAHSSSVASKNFKGAYYAVSTTLRNQLVNNNKLYQGSDMQSIPYTSVNINNNYNDKNTFITGSNGVNGEVYVSVPIKVSSFFSNKVKTLTGTAKASPIFINFTGGSSDHQIQNSTRY